MDPGFEKGKIIFNNMVRLYVNMRKEDYHDLTVKNIFLSYQIQDMADPFDLKELFSDYNI